jgi:hypothetical protein
MNIGVNAGAVYRRLANEQTTESRESAPQAHDNGMMVIMHVRNSAKA